MKKLLIILAVSSTLGSFAFGADPDLKDQKDKVSYSIGLDIGNTLKRQTIDVNQDVLARGIQDGLTGKTPLMNKDQVKETMVAFQKELTEKQTVSRKAAGEKNKAAGDKFLAENKQKDGVKTTADGLQYKVLKQGTGPKPKETDNVKVNYRGTTIDGTEFDSSYKRGEPASFPVNRVIKGWTEGLQLMNTGSKYQLVIPSDLAYGERGAGQEIGPNSVLIFEVELLQVAPGVKPINPLAHATIPPAASPSPSPSAAPK